MASRILVIDDDAGTREALSDILVRAGYQVTVWGDDTPLITGETGQNYQVAVVDYHLPSSNGLQVAARLKVLYPDCRVVLISADLPPGLDFGQASQVVDRFLAKPFSKDTILKVVARFCHPEHP